ncbi:hypothetical protein EAS64_34000 [Trebonia kvetii]|uniref:Uncharacterized protein n=1 Tax=Trebonia kvetii TaxID=2480626 RepID=A0A6P2BVQ5_9ACTN|nr:hypothetical protein [Trebonia kvetii]TVZ01293.1 hypothetical protein EAS64_34000 [Trebonia kvetii]
MSTDDRISIEDRIRIATRARASMVRDLRPLPAPGLSPLRHRSAAPARRSRRWVTWGIPLAAAVAVVAIALSLAAIRHESTLPVKPSPPAIETQGIPRYFAAVEQVPLQVSAPKALIVGDDKTGAVIATVPAPRGVILGPVVGMADDRTFLVTGEADASSPHRKAIWYRLRIAPGTAHPYQLTKLPGSVVNGTRFAVSPDGTELAVESSPSLHLTKLAVVSLASGKTLRTWTTTTGIQLAPAAANLSWLSDGTHVTFGTVHTTSMQVRTLDVTAPGADLLADSRVLVTIPLSGAGTCETAQATPDGGTVVCATQYSFVSQSGRSADCLKYEPGFIAYSVRTGKPVRVLYRSSKPCTAGIANTVWLDASARHVIGAVRFPSVSGALDAGELGVITQARGFQQIKLPKAVIPADFESMAF